MVKGEGNSITINEITYPLDYSIDVCTFYYISPQEVSITKNKKMILHKDSPMTEEEGFEILKKYPFRPKIHENTELDFVLAWVEKITDYALEFSWATKEKSKEMYGDDWNDYSYEDNAGSVYPEFVNLTDLVELNPGWIYQDLHEFGAYNEDGDFYYKEDYWIKYQNQYTYAQSTNVCVNDLRDNDYIYGRIINTRTGDCVYLKLAQTVNNDLWRELKKKGAIN